MFRIRSLKEMKKKLKRKRRPLWALGLVAWMLLAAAAGIISEVESAKAPGSAWSAVNGNAAVPAEQTRAPGTSAVKKPMFHERYAAGANVKAGLEPGDIISLFVDPLYRDFVVRTFFQLDIRSLETRMSPEMLPVSSAGIRVDEDGLPGDGLFALSDGSQRQTVRGGARYDESINMNGG